LARMWSKTVGLMAVMPSLITGLFFSDCARDENGGSLYDFSMTSLDGTEVVDFGEYAGKATLLVNVATY